MHYAGQDIARLRRDQTVCKDPAPSQTRLIKFMSWFMFFAPIARLVMLQRIYVDKLVSEVPWNKFITKQLEDWQGFVAMVSGFLNARSSVYLRMPFLNRLPCSVSIGVTI
jgi:hypothetical protein